VGSDVQYYNLELNWHRIASHLTDAEVRETLLRDFGTFILKHDGRRFHPGQVPAEFETNRCPACDARLRGKDVRLLLDKRARLERDARLA
jgi:hypothetical protein